MPDHKLVREIHIIFRGMACHWAHHEEPTIAKELLEVSLQVKSLAARMKKRRPKL